MLAAPAIIVATSIQAPAQETLGEEYGAEATRAFVASLRREAQADDVSLEVFDEAFAGFKPDARVVKADAYQPEFVRPIWGYLDKALSPTRIERGRGLLESEGDLLERLENRYGVSREVLTAIWGLETNYGSNKGGYFVPHALATLGMGERRSDYGRTQALAALRILERGEATLETMKGSWAGAMGHTQFIPTTYERYAADWDGDGKRDVWGNAADALASTAHYLSESGWRWGETWGFEVFVGEGFDYEKAEGWRELGEWGDLGLKRADAVALAGGAEARLIQPTGYRGPAFLALRNFSAVLRYNSSTSYGLAVGLLSGRLLGLGGVLKRDWRRDEGRASRAGVEEAQRALTGLGYDTGGADGLAGPRTRKAIRRYQKERGLTADGYLDAGLLERLRLEVK